MIWIAAFVIAVLAAIVIADCIDAGHGGEQE
jgi:hypothetical protein